jgi:hypothetical protein
MTVHRHCLTLSASRAGMYIYLWLHLYLYLYLPTCWLAYILLHPCMSAHHPHHVLYSELIFTSLSPCAAIRLQRLPFVYSTARTYDTAALKVVACMHIMLACILS